MNDMTNTESQLAGFFDQYVKNDRMTLISKQRQRLNLGEVAGSVDIFTKEELLTMFERSIDEDLGMAISGCGFTPNEFQVTIEPMTKYEHAADDLLTKCFSAWCDDETERDHMSRIYNIVQILSSTERQRPMSRIGAEQCPIFRIGGPEDDIRASDNARRLVQCWDVTEGLHRLVAFQQVGLKTVPVVWITYE
jgi:hypothetical protein